jgi:bifunctional non-homologous end joining protein LigD
LGGDSQIANVSKRSSFIIPAAPALKLNPPSGPQWVHECKFDGWRGQLHKTVDDVVVCSRNGKDLSRRFRAIAHSLRVLPAKSAIIDCELVACDSDGMPSFSALMAGGHTLCAWCFDVMELNGRDLRELPLVKRKEKLRDLLIKADDDVLRYSDDFEDPLMLLQVAQRMDLEGIVSKRSDAPYRSGKAAGWTKTRTATWRAANRERYLLFEKV